MQFSFYGAFSEENAPLGVLHKVISYQNFAFWDSKFQLYEISHPKMHNWLHETFFLKKQYLRVLKILEM